MQIMNAEHIDRSFIFESDFYTAVWKTRKRLGSQIDDMAKSRDKCTLNVD